MIHTTYLRPGTSDDVDAMYGLDLLCFAEPFRFDLPFMRRCASDPRALVIVAEAEEALAGFVIANLRRRRTHTSAYITTLDVHPACRGRGVGRTLMAEVERQVLGLGAIHVDLHVFTENAGAIRFYEAAGYTQGLLVEDFYGPARDAWMYRKPLQPAGT